jgi:hypothetical protein
MTAKKYMGLFPRTTMVEDCVCVLYGCSMPVILRRQGDHYIFVGVAYVHGLMDGEVIQLHSQGQISEQDFKMH